MMSQMKGQDKTPEKQPNEVEIGNLPGKEIKIMIVKRIQDFRKPAEKMQDMFAERPKRTKEQTNRDEHYTRRYQ